MAIDVLTVSSKGQVVLPASMRKSLSIEPGSHLAAYTSDDFIMLKVLHLPDEDDFKAKLDEAQAWAASVGYTEDDVEDVIRSVREKKQK
ncbi:MAG: AbrB/MazE/SpoVT family DNA-binding domain-containing protein [Clostridia bacterium]|nr:AbrB/MazE/SpoVT family DNA-binding domain-containing protein [Clostridia bacterium]MBQ9189743.1 AbrB/MazE/SpoVT family DNA-binding domain-containing protein [Clostridia bacterium]